MVIEELPKEKRVNAIVLLQQGWITHEVSKLLNVFESICLRIVRKYVFHLEPIRRRLPWSLTPIRRRLT